MFHLYPTATLQALHYKELEFKESPDTAVEALIQLNNQLRQPDAANGMLIYAQKYLHQDSLTLQQSWYEKLQRWQDAVNAYNIKLAKPVRFIHKIIPSYNQTLVNDPGPLESFVPLSKTLVPLSKTLVPLSTILAPLSKTFVPLKALSP